MTGTAEIFDRAQALTDRGDYTEGLRLLEALRASGHVQADRHLQAEVELRCAEVIFRFTGREEECLDYLARATALGSGSTTEALSWLLQGDVLRYLRRPTEALAALETAITGFHNLQDPCGECLAEKAKAIILEETGSSQQALVHFLRALELAMHENDAQEAAELSLLCGGVLKRLGRRREASFHFIRAADLYKATGNTDREGEARAELVTVLGNTPPGRAQLGRMTELLFEKLGDEHRTVETESVGAEMLGEIAERYAGAGALQLEARCRNERARLLERNNPRDCVTEYVRAGHLFDLCQSPSDAADAYYFGASTLTRLAALDASLRDEAYNLALLGADRARESGNWQLRGMALFLAATALWKDRPTDKSDPRKLGLLRDAGEAFSQAGLPADAAQAHLAWALEVAPEGFESLAYAADVALDSYELGRASLVVPSVRNRTDSHTRRALTVLIAEAARSDRRDRVRPEWAELVWRLAQSVKGRSFQDQRLSDAAWNYLVRTDEQLRSLTLREEGLIREIEGLTEAAEFAVRRGDDEQAEHAAVSRRLAQDALRNVAAGISERLNHLARSGANALNLESTPPATVATVKGCLRDDEVFVDYLWAGGLCCRSVIGSAGQTECSLIDVGRSDAGTSPGDESRTTGEALFPVLSDEIHTVIISPDGPLIRRPWLDIELSDGSSCTSTGERFAMAVVPSAGLLAQIRHEAHISPTLEYIGVACDGSGGVEEAELEWVDAEVTLVGSSYFSSATRRVFTTVDCDHAFSEERSVGLLHLACHADRRGLLVSTAGRWTLPSDLLELGIHCQVILLTGCNAGKFAADDNNEFFGVLRQLLTVTHAQCAIASRAPVPDLAGALFADLVVAALTSNHADRPWEEPKAPLTAGHAVRWARNRLRRLTSEDITSYVHGASQVYLEPYEPSWWSPWFVVGDPCTVLNRVGFAAGQEQPAQTSK